MEYGGWVMSMAEREVEASISLHSYAVNSHLRHLAFDEAKWSDLVEQQYPNEQEQIDATELVRRVYEASLISYARCPSPGSLSSYVQRLRTEPEQEESDAWRTLTIPVDLPALDVNRL